MNIEPRTAISEALMLHQSIGILKSRQQIAFAMDCVNNVPLKKMFCPTDRIFLNELHDVMTSVLSGEDGALDVLALMIPLVSEMSAELYNSTRSNTVDVQEHNRNMAASHMADAYLGLAELVYCHSSIQGCISSPHDIAKNVRQATYWLSNSLEREKLEMVFQQKRVERHMYSTGNEKLKQSAEIIPFKLAE